MSDLVRELLRTLERLPDAARKEAQDLIARETGSMVFVPSPGPQTQAYRSKADILLFGGNPGGGKTALQVGLALNEHQRSLVVRRSFVDLAGVLHTLDNILGQPGSAVGGNRPVYRKPNGGVIDFMGLGDDLGGKQGNPHDLLCVGYGTPVLMADGSYRAVEQVCEGDYVATLQGPRMVLKAFPTSPKPSIHVTVNGVSQIQSATHKLLTTSGWASLDAEPHPCGICAPKRSQNAGTSFASFFRIHPAAWRRSWILGCCPPPIRAALLTAQRLGRKALSAFDGRKARPDQESACGACGGTRPRWPLRLLWWGWLTARRTLRRAWGCGFETPGRFFDGCGGDGARKTSSPVGCRGNCSAGSRLCGERTPSPPGPRLEPGGVLRVPLLLADAGPRTPSDSRGDGGARVPTRTHRKLWYDHPYGKGKRQSRVHLSESACQVSFVGEVPLFDLEVAGENHFITLGGFVNKNCIDEAAQVPEDHVRMLLGWMRSDRRGQRCRMVLGSNPPLDAVGDWMIPFFAPWLDPHHPNPAQQGELRYFLPTEDGHGDRECDPSDRMTLHGVQVAPLSRTFIESRFTDNPFYDAEKYAMALAGLPVSARAILMSGSFISSRPDDMWQAIPTEWVQAAQARWSSQRPAGVPQCAIGVDVAQGGSDNTVLAIRHDGWYAPLIVKPGKETPDGRTAAGLIMTHRRDESKPIVDVGGGWGADCYAHLRENKIDARSYMGLLATHERTTNRQHGFTNVRTAAYWRFREALDPSQPGGSPICLPPDAMLRADLCAPTYSMTAHGYALEPKQSVVDRLKRSPDRGDAVIMAWWDGMKQPNVAGGWKEHARNRRPQVRLGYEQTRGL